MDAGGAAPGLSGAGGVSRGPLRFRLPASGAGADRFAAWCAALGPVFACTAAPAGAAAFAGPAAAAAFTGEVQFTATAQALLSEITAAPLRLLRSPASMARCRASDFTLWLITGGSLTGQAGPRPVAAQPGDILLLDLQQSCDLASAPDQSTAWLGLWLPRAILSVAMTRSDTLHGHVLAAHSPAAGLLGASLRALASAAPGMAAPALEGLIGGVTQLAVQALRQPNAGAGGADGSASLTTFLTIRQFIDANILLPGLGATMLAQKFGLSRASLYRLFEPAGGVANYIKQQRLQLAFAEVVAPEAANQRLGPIGYRHGFRNFSAFSRAFKAAYGQSPREARQAALGRE